MPDDHPSPWSPHAPSGGDAAPAAYGASTPPPAYAPPPYAAVQPFQPAQPPQPLQPYGPYAPYAAYGPSLAAPALPASALPARPPGRGLAITGIVLGGLALLGVVLMMVFVLVVAVMGISDPGGGGGYGPLRGTIAPASGGTLSGPALAQEVTQTVLDDGGEPESIVCPASTKVAQDVTAVCHGADFGVDSAFVVFFEDDQGSYTLLEI